MHNIYKIITLLIFSVSLAGADSSVSDELSSKVKATAEERLEGAMNDLFKNVEIDLSGFEDGKPEFGITSLIPIVDHPGRASFFQGSLSTRNEVDRINLGFAQRHFFLDNKILVGANIFYDELLGKHHSRWSLGMDLLSSLGDIHANYYEAQSGRVINGAGNYEYVLGGYDFKLGLPVPYFPTFKIYLEDFSWNSKFNAPDLEGEVYRLTSKLPYGMRLTLGQTFYQNYNQDEEFIKLSINLMELKKPHEPIQKELKNLFSPEPFTMEMEDVTNRRFDQVEREKKVIVQTVVGSTVTISATSPAISSGATTAQTAITFTFQFSNDVTGFDVSDISSTNGTFGSFSTVDANTYTAVLTNSTAGLTSIDVAHDNLSDALGRPVRDATAFTYTYDSAHVSSATVGISANDGTVLASGGTSNSTTLTLTFQFDETVTGFDVSDLTTTSGTFSSFTAVDGDTYTVVLTNTTTGAASVDINHAGVLDSLGNALSDVTAFTYTYTPLQITITIKGYAT